MTTTTVNPVDEISEVRANTGGIGVLNIPDADVDTALSAADQETTERTGLESNSIYKPFLRRKIKILLATNYLLLRFKNSKDQINLISAEITQVQNLLAVPDISDIDDETIIDSTDTTLTLESWLGSRKRSFGFRNGLYNNSNGDVLAARLGFY